MPVAQTPFGAPGSGTLALVGAGSGAAGTVSASISPAAANATAYVSGFHITGLGATGATTVVATLSTLVGGSTLSYDIVVPAGVTTAITPIFVNFVVPMPATSAGSGITISVPSFGAGNTSVHVGIWGFSQ